VSATSWKLAPPATCTMKMDRRTSGKEGHASKLVGFLEMLGVIASIACMHAPMHAALYVRPEALNPSTALLRLEAPTPQTS
jgi:hypothetical protein